MFVLDTNVVSELMRGRRPDPSDIVMGRRTCDIEPVSDGGDRGRVALSVLRSCRRASDGTAFGRDLER